MRHIAIAVRREQGHAAGKQPHIRKPRRRLGKHSRINRTRAVFRSESNQAQLRGSGDEKHPARIFGQQGHGGVRGIDEKFAAHTRRRRSRRGHKRGRVQIRVLFQQNRPPTSADGSDRHAALPGPQCQRAHRFVGQQPKRLPAEWKLQARRDHSRARLRRRIPARDQHAAIGESRREKAAADGILGNSGQFRARGGRKKFVREQFAAGEIVKFGTTLIVDAQGHAGRRIDIEQSRRA